MNKVSHVAALVVAPAWPSYRSGSGIALASSVEQYSQVFDQVHFVSIQDNGAEACPEMHYGNVEFTVIDFRRRRKWLRFVASLPGSLPAVAAPYASEKVVSRLLMHLQKVVQDHSGILVILEDIPVSSLALAIRRRFPQLPVVVKSHNVLAKAFEPFTARGFPLTRVAWRLEVSKIARLERSLLELGCRFWCISEADLAEYERRYTYRPHGVFGVSMDPERYSDVAPGSITNVLFIGTADLRKGAGLRDFIDYAWREIRRRFPSARLHLGGRLTHRYADEANGIYGMGFVDDELGFLDQGVIFINPQEIGSGVNLKSITAMLAGKALVSTEKGVEGIQGREGEHFLVASSAKQLATPVIDLMENPQTARALGQRAKRFVADAYSPTQLARTVRPLLKDVIDLAVCRKENCSEFARSRAEVPDEREDRPVGQCDS